MEIQDSIFVWRTYERAIDIDLNTLLYEIETPLELASLFDFENSFLQNNVACPYCGLTIFESFKFSDEEERAVFCKNCGWGKESSAYLDSPFKPGNGITPSRIEISTSEGKKELYEENDESESELTIIENKIRLFNLSSAELTQFELANYFSKNFNKINNFSWNRFESLVGDLFRLQGFRVEQTIKTRDGGFDLKLFNNGSEQILVEVKRRNGTVGVSVIRQIMGVQLIEGFRKAKIVTNGQFTGPARQAANSINYNLTGYQLELVDGEELLRLLGAYKHNKSLIDVTKIRQRLKK